MAVAVYFCWPYSQRDGSPHIRGKPGGGVYHYVRAAFLFTIFFLSTPAAS
jgi:hypothetical protein